MTTQTTAKANETAAKAAKERREREARAMLAKHLHPPVVNVFKGIRF